MKKIISTISLVFALFVFSGCQEWEDPNGNAGGASRMGSDSLMASSIPGDGFADGLNARGDMGDLSNIDYEHLNPENVLQTIYFGFDQYSIPASERSKVKDAAAQMSNNAGMRVILVAHTDWLGTEEYNLLLSDKRGESVKEYLASFGIGAERAEVVARGKQGATPDVSKDSAEARNDRRVEIYRTK